MGKAIVFFADGFEECEGLLVVDLLRRAGVDVKTASINGSTRLCSCRYCNPARWPERHGKPCCKYFRKREMSGICKRKKGGCHLCCSKYPCLARTA